MSHMVKSTDGYDVKVPSKGATDYAVVGGSLGIASFLGLNAGNLLGGDVMVAVSSGAGVATATADAPCRHACHSLRDGDAARSLQQGQQDCFLRQHLSGPEEP